MTKVLISLALVLCLNGYSKPKPKHHMALKDSLIAYWDMEQNPALYQIWDQSGNGYQLTGHNSQVNAPGISDSGVVFNGINQWLSRNTTPSHQGSPFTVGFWFKPAILTNGVILVTCTEWGAGIAVSSGNYVVEITIGSKTFQITDVPLSVGQWYFLAFGWYTNNGSFVWGTVNLSDRVRVFNSSLTPQPNLPFQVGGTEFIGWFSGVIDEFAIWRREVPANELRQIYNDGAGLSFEEWDTVQECVSSNCCD